MEFRTDKIQIKNVPYILIYQYSILLIVLSFLFQSPSELINGFIKIILSPSNLITDYVQLSGLGSAFFNSGVVTLLTAILLHRFYAHVTGPLLASIFTVSGFSFFGKNILNSIPIMYGVFLYARFFKISCRNVILTAIFGTCLAPLVSEVAFKFPFIPVINIFIAFLVGIIAGFLLVPLSSKFSQFHMGFSLYNIGFSAGVIAMIMNGFFKMFGFTILPQNIVYKGDDLYLKIFVSALCILLLLIGLLIENFSLSDFKKILNEPGIAISDFIDSDGLGPTLINMGLVGIIGIVYVFAVGGKFNGPIVGSILTMVGFGAFGKTVKNVIPVMVGIFLCMKLNVYNISDTNSIMVCLFGTALAPVAGFYGAFWGIIAGILHTALVANVGLTHGGVNLYNNGFSSGFIAAFIIPVIETFRMNRKASKALIE